MTHASVFSGIGGPEVAATMLGWENLFHCEINPFGRAVLDYWYPNAKSYEDITTTDFSEWRGKVDVLTGGFPCQPFSYAGQRRGAQDDRYLWPYMFRCIDAVRPRWVVAENVAGILTMVEQGEVSGVETQGSLFDEADAVRRYRLRETFTLQRICDDLEGHGYAVQPVLIPACAVGAPHRRDRVFIVGRRRDDIVADTDNGADGRAAGADEGEGGAERLQERHEVRKPDEPNQVRPKSSEYATDTECERLLLSEHIGQSRLREGLPSGRGGRYVGEGVTSHAVGGGEGTPGEGGGLESDGSHEDKQPRQWGAASEWNSRFYELLRNAADTDHNGLQHDSIGREQADVSGAKSEGGQDRLSEQIQRIATVSEGRPTAIPGHAADTDGEGRKEPQQPGRGTHQAETGARVDDRTERPNADDAWNADSDKWESNRKFFEGQGAESEGVCEGCSGTGRWAGFPSQSPVHRGNDGLPFSLDDLTLSPAKWRTEALKAYGNAIVPQVMYEIFRAIEIAEKPPKP